MTKVRKEFGVIIISKVYRDAKCLVIKKIKEQFLEDFRVLNNYATELKTTNPRSNVNVVSENLKADELTIP